MTFPSVTIATRFPLAAAILVAGVFVACTGEDTVPFRPTPSTQEQVLPAASGDPVSPSSNTRESDDREALRALGRTMRERSAGAPAPETLEWRAERDARREELRRSFQRVHVPGHCGCCTGGLLDGPVDPVLAPAVVFD